MQNQFDQLAQTHPEETELEFWFAHDLQEPLGGRISSLPSKERFSIAKQQVASLSTIFCGVTKMVILGSGAERRIEVFMITTA